MKIKKKIPLIDQASKLGFWDGKFGGNYVPETLKKPIEDLEILFNKLKITLWLLAEIPIFFDFLSNSLIICAAVKVFPTPGGP